MSDVCLTIHSNKLLSGATVTWSEIKRTRTRLNEN